TPAFSRPGSYLGNSSPGMWASRICGFCPVGGANGTSRTSPGGLVLVRHRRLWRAVICTGKVETRKKGWVSPIEPGEAAACHAVAHAKAGVSCRVCTLGKAFLLFDALSLRCHASRTGKDRTRGARFRPPLFAFWR